MSVIRFTAEEIGVLNALANGIIPADARDKGASAVESGGRIAERARAGINASLYADGLRLAMSLSREKFGRTVELLKAAEVHELLGLIERASPGFFRQLRLDVCAFYLSDPGVWQRIGFPGPSTESGGYPDFDQQQR